MRSILWSVVFALCLSGSVFAQDASQPGYCPVAVSATSLKGHDDEAVFSLWADDRAAKATGTLAVYAGNRRYRIPFTAAVAADILNPKILPTPIVVRFDPATRVDSAYVASLEGADCIVHNPFIRSGLQNAGSTFGPVDGSSYPNWSKEWKIFLELAADTPALRAPSAETVDAPACAKPYATAYAAHPAPVTPPRGGYLFNGEVGLNLEIGSDGSLLGLRVDKSSHLPPVDAAAVDAAERSQFAPQVYRCNPVTADYLFRVEFSGTLGTRTIRWTSSP